MYSSLSEKKSRQGQLKQRNKGSATCAHAAQGVLEFQKIVHHLVPIKGIHSCDPVDLKTQNIVTSYHIISYIYIYI